MSGRCPNGHDTGAHVRWDANGGTGTYCPTCGASLDGRPKRPPITWVVFLVLLLFLVVGVLIPMAIVVFSGAACPASECHP